MAEDAECYQVNADDRAIILNVRAWYSQIFIAPDWTDLRLGFFTSLVDAAVDNQTTALDEAMGLTGGIGPHDRYWMGAAWGHPGVGIPSPPRPRRPGEPQEEPTGHASTFIGFTNSIERYPNLRGGDSVLVSSDAGIGTTNTNFWRPGNASDNRWGAAIYDGVLPRARIIDNIQQHFPQNSATVAAGYAVLHAIQLLRDNADSKTITAKIKSSVHSSDWLYSNTPTKELIHTTLESWPAGSAQMGPVALSHVPAAFYFYWPFRKSRLRIHSIGMLRAAP